MRAPTLSAPYTYMQQHTDGVNHMCVIRRGAGGEERYVCELPRELPLTQLHEGDRDGRRPFSARLRQVLPRPPPIRRAVDLHTHARTGKVSSQHESHAVRTDATR
jgi:hypothetical protein